MKIGSTISFSATITRQACISAVSWTSVNSLPVVSGSSDGTVKAWNPHALPSSEPTVIGLHGDYIRCITYSREQRWIASGSFDRSIKLWDLNGSSKTEPLATLALPDVATSKSSIYALTTDPFGHTIASGSPERVIRLWDPRTGKRTGKLVGHTDNIRTILISDDSRYLLTGSADASIKLWSLTSQRCLHTFTYHTDSVWSLHSNHPSLEVFYSGDKSGLVCKVDVEGCADLSEGECILLCNESSENASAGINKVVSMDDNLLWTASGVSSINRWRVPQRRSVRAVISSSQSTHHWHDDAGIMNVESSPSLHQPLTASPTRLSHALIGNPEFTSSASSSSTRPPTATGPGDAPAHTSTPTSALPLIPHRMHHSISFDTTDEHEHEHEHEQDQDRDSDTRFGIPCDSLVRLTLPNDPFPYHLGRGGGGGGGGPAVHTGRYDLDADVATLYSAASFLSIPRALTHPKSPFVDANRGMFQHPHRTRDYQRAHVNASMHPAVYPQNQHQRHAHQHSHSHGHGRSLSQSSPPRNPHYDPSSHQYPAQTQVQVQTHPRSRAASPTTPHKRHTDSDSYSHVHYSSLQSAHSPHAHVQVQSYPHLHSYPSASHNVSASEQTIAPGLVTFPSQAQTSSPSASAFAPLTPAPLPLPPHHSAQVLSPQANYELRELASEATPLYRTADYVIQGDVGIIRTLPLNDRIHVLTVDTAGEVAVWDIVRGCCLGRYAGTDVATASIAGSVCGGKGGDGVVNASAGAGASVVNDGATTGSGVVAAGEKSPRESLEVVRERIEGQAVIPKWASVDTKGGVLIVHLNERCFEVEVYADEVGYAHEKGFTEESKLNLGRWVLRNLFLGFIKEEQRMRKELQGGQHTPSPTDSTGKAHEGILLYRTTNVNASPARTHHRVDSSRRRGSSSPEVLRKFQRSSSGHPTFCSGLVVSAPDMILALPPSTSFPLDTHPVPLSTPLIPIQTENLTSSRLGDPTSARHPSPLSSSPIRTRNRAGTLDGSTYNGSRSYSGMPRAKTFAAPATGGVPLTITPADYFASLTRLSQHRTPQRTSDVINGASASASATPTDESAGWSGPLSGKTHTSDALRPLTPTGLMGRLKNFGGKIHRRPLSEAGNVVTPLSAIQTGALSTTTTTTTTPTSPTRSSTKMTHDSRRISSDMASKDPENALIQQILSGPLSPPSSSDTPTLPFPSQTLLLISEEASPNPRTIYRGTAGTTHYDVRSLEETMPAWLLIYLLQNKMPTAPQVSKVSFVLLPWVSGDPEVGTLPELLNTAQSKLTANRYIRVRKLVIHVQEKLDRINASSAGMGPAAVSPTLSTFDEKQGAKQRAEDLYEILCNDVLLPLEMTLAAVRQYVWKSSAELTMYYRLKIGKRRSHKLSMG
ncbi:hypothetical protein AX15_000450 [Amanita polypyramis BW_CC]|nr:hypothetical protein AX15_000450 [Amanita polypyramis BW_CC]